MNLPSNHDAETSLLSAFFLHPQQIGCMLAERGVTPEYFTHSGNIVIASIALEAWAKGEMMDVMLLIATLKQRGLFEEAGGIDVFIRMTSMPTAANAQQYLDLIVEAYQLRKIAILCAQKEKEACSAGADPKAILSTISQEITVLSGGASKSRAKTMKQHMLDKMDRIESQEPDKNIIPTGITKLDANSPLKFGDMTLISGERKAGKSIFAINVAVNAASNGVEVLYFSLEDMADKVVDRMFAKVSKIPIVQHTSKGVTEWQLSSMQAAAVKLAGLKIAIHDDIHDLFGIVARIRQAKIEKPEFRLAVVDYAQLVRFPMPKGSLREQEVATISRTLRLLAMELDIAILLLCQLNKDGDTRESKSLEQDCTAMWKLLHDEEENAGKRIISIPFQRNGESGIGFPVSFLGATSRIEDFIEDPE